MTDGNFFDREMVSIEEAHVYDAAVAAEMPAEVSCIKVWWIRIRHQITLEY